MQQRPKKQHQEREREKTQRKDIKLKISNLIKFNKCSVKKESTKAKEMFIEKNKESWKNSKRKKIFCFAGEIEDEE